MQWFIFDDFSLSWILPTPISHYCYVFPVTKNNSKFIGSKECKRPKDYFQWSREVFCFSPLGSLVTQVHTWYIVETTLNSWSSCSVSQVLNYKLMPAHPVLFGAGEETQGLTGREWALYQLSHIPRSNFLLHYLQVNFTWVESCYLMFILFLYLLVIVETHHRTEISRK